MSQAIHNSQNREYWTFQCLDNAHASDTQWAMFTQLLHHSRMGESGTEVYVLQGNQRHRQIPHQFLATPNAQLVVQSLYPAVSFTSSKQAKPGNIT